MNIKTLLYTLILVLALSSLGSSLFAQTPSNRYFGFSGSFGMRSQTVSSNYNGVNGMPLTQYGGSAGVIYGTSAARLKSEIGVYYSASDVPHTTNMVELASSINIYPLQLFAKKDRAIEPYLIAGVSRNTNKFYGFYHMADTSPNINHSVSMEPYIGKITALQTTVGAGIEIHLGLGDDYSFVHLFVEAKYSRLVSTGNSSLLAETSLSNQLLGSVGILVGKRY
jgi:hypothetical protein